MMTADDIGGRPGNGNKPTGFKHLHGSAYCPGRSPVFPKQLKLASIVDAIARYLAICFDKVSRAVLVDAYGHDVLWPEMSGFRQCASRVYRVASMAQGILR